MIDARVSSATMEAAAAELERHTGLTDSEPEEEGPGEDVNAGAML